MNKYPAAAVFLLILINISCVNQRPAFIPDVDNNVFNYEKTENINQDDIIDTKDGLHSASEEPEIIIPEWLRVFLYGGTGAVEMLRSYNGKYIFIAVSQGVNLAALNIWTERFSSDHDFPMYAAERIEKRMTSSAAQYPDYEYGLFFERLVKNAFSWEYSGVKKEDSYWIKILTDNASSQTYMAFILLSVDRLVLQNIINEMITKTITEVTPTRAQTTAINRLKQNFFSGF